MPPIDREGIFRANVMDIEFKAPKEGSEAVNLNIKFAITEARIGTEWENWAEHGFECRGSACLVKKDGTVCNHGVETMRDALGWNGSVADIESGTFKPWPCQIEVGPDAYRGEGHFEAKWINHFNSEGGSGMKKATPDDTKGFNAQHGAAMRAICTKATTKAPAAGDDIPF
jgi:hypothetical protein